MITAPVSVARSTIRSAPKETAWQRQSASTSRPSASVLLISIVFPFFAVTMSPGLTARPSGRFSVAPTTASSFTGSFRRAIAATASTTAAPPDMSNFISAIFGPGFSEMPPLSNVTALPTKPSNGPFASPPSYRRTISAGSCSEPCATAAKAPMPSPSMPERPCTSTCRPSISSPSARA